MKTMIMNGVKEKIPPYPHPKNYAYRMYWFFNCPSLPGFVRWGNFRWFKELSGSRRYHCVVPREILFDPTNACNMHCKGCWAGDYEHASSISFERWDELLREAEDMGTMDMLYTGGEPLMRKDELLELAKKYNGICHGVFTNASLVDEAFIDDMEALGNIILFISIEGYRDETDFRRGEGAYERTIKVMEALKARGIAYGVSLCYHTKNYDLLTSDEYLDFLREKGAWLIWAFSYRPIGKGADMSLVLNAEQRMTAFERFSSYSAKHMFPIADLFNSGHKTFGCVGGGDGYIHINADGDVEPCSFLHYSDSNINSMTLAEALNSPFMRAFRRKKFNTRNPFAPCPAFDEPEILVGLCRETGARSTHAEPESAEEYAQKAGPYAEEWHALTCDKCLWASPKAQKRYKGLQRFFKFRWRLAGE